MPAHKVVPVLAGALAPQLGLAPQLALGLELALVARVGPFVGQRLAHCLNSALLAGPVLQVELELTAAWERRVEPASLVEPVLSVES